MKHTRRSSGSGQKRLQIHPAAHRVFQQDGASHPASGIAALTRRRWVGGHEVLDVTDAPADGKEKLRRFVEGLTSEERLLVVLKNELYDGSWDEMAADLKARLEGRPYIFKLAHRIADDLERIRRLREFEQGCDIDLADYVKLES